MVNKDENIETMIRKLICLIVVISLSLLGLTSVLSSSDVNPFLADDLVPDIRIKVKSFSIDGKMELYIVCETKPVTGGRLLVAAPDPEFEIVLLSRKSFADESWTETVAGKVAVPPNGQIEFSSDLLNLTVKARIVAGDKFFKIKIR